MTLYKDNPKLKLQVITTVGGRKEYKRNCRFIRSIERPEGAFYVKNEDIFPIDETWYRVESGKIELDHETKTWVLKNSKNLTRGVVGINQKPDSGDLFAKREPRVIYGMFSPNVYNNCLVHTEQGTMTCINSDILADDYFEDIGTNIWYLKKGMSAVNFKKMTTIRNEINHHVKGYNIEDNAQEFEEKKSNYAKYPLKISKEATSFGKFLGDSTYGAEIETSEGNLPTYLQHRHGIVICRDGSIKSAEYVTVPMSGAKGVQNIADIADHISARCNIDINCSLHYHFGNLPKEREYLVALYILGYKIQDDLFKMFPYFKTDHRGFKKKNYCQKLKKMNIHPCLDLSKEGYDSYINEIYRRIFIFLGDGHVPGENVNRKRQQHPIHHKWDRHSRYYWLNLQNMIFSDRETAEFRMHTATSNKVKMIAWLFICNAIVKYAEKHIRDIITCEGNISLINVLKHYATEHPTSKAAKYLTEYLIAYYNSRCAVFAADFQKGDKLSEHDITNDKTFDFTYKEQRLIP